MVRARLIATTDGDTYNYPAEVIEQFPLAMERNALNVAAGGGAGRRRGGFGTIRESRVSQSNRRLSARLARPVRTTAMGVDGGELGTNNFFEVVRGDGENIRGGRVTNLPLGGR